MADVTVAALTYRDIRWIEWMLEGLNRAKNETTWRPLVVACDGEWNMVERYAGVEALVDVWHRNPNPHEYYINRVYRAWNRAVTEARTQWVVLLNSDMYVSDYWLDELVEYKRRVPKSLPTSLLVESGRIPSAMPEHVKNFGESPEVFDVLAWEDHAVIYRQRGLTEPGRLFMPVLVDREEFLDLGGYPHGNPVVDGKAISGDKALFDLYKEAGYEWVTCLGSVVYHTQMGEMGLPVAEKVVQKFGGES